MIFEIIIGLFIPTIFATSYCAMSKNSSGDFGD